MNAHLSKGLIIFWFISLILFQSSCSSQSPRGGDNYASTRDNVKTKQNRKSGKNNFDPNTVRKFKPKTAKERQKEEKMKKKPQYSDPMYFGHKKPPKKRPRGKQKYCKECGMRH